MCFMVWLDLQKSSPWSFYLSSGTFDMELNMLRLNRLQYFARGLQVYIRQLRVALQGKTGDALKTEEVTTTVSLSLVA